MTRNRYRRHDLYIEVRREALKKAFPQINRLERLTELEELNLDRVDENLFPYLCVYYTAISKYNNIRKILLDKLIAKEQNVKFCSRKPLINLERDGVTEEEERYYSRLSHFDINVKLVYPRSPLEIHLKVTKKEKIKKD